MRSFRLKYVKYDMLKNRYCVLVYLVEIFATKCTTNKKKGSAKKIIRLQRRFFWVANENRREIPHVVCDIIQRSKNPGLKVGNITVKNATMLFKCGGSRSIKVTLYEKGLSILIMVR